MKKINFQGTITALITPFKRNGEVDFPNFEKLIDYQIDNGADAIVVCGSTGESATLTTKEKQALIIRSVEYSAGRIPVIAGTGTNETEMTINLSLFAKEHGADGLLVVTPYYNKPPQDGLFEHFRLIADTVQIPVILYNVPGRTAVNMLPETQLRIARTCKNVVATKEASGNLEQMMAIIKNAPEHFHLLSGDDALTLPVIAMGGKGIVSVISNYAAKQFSEMVKLALKGKFSDALKIHYHLFDLMQLNFIEPNPMPVKCAMTLLKMSKEIYRMPLLAVKPENKIKIKDALVKAGLMK